MTERAPLSRAAALAAALGLSACAAGPEEFTASATSKSPEQRVIGRIMAGIGAVDPDEERVTYQPRAPLVMPPRRDLPAPQGEAAPAAANWPNDPDVAEREARKARRAAQPDPSKVWTPEELSKYRIEGAGRVQPQEVGQDRPLPPDKLRAGRINVPEEAKDANGQPVRRSLTDPPLAYRQPSPNAPVALPEDEKPSKWTSWWPF